MAVDEPPPRKSRRDWEEEEQYHWEMEEAARLEQEAKEAEEAQARESAIETMVSWFNEQFQDPATDTPWDGEEKQYVYPFGGPFEAGDVIHDQFREEFPEEWISEAVDAVEQEGITEWAPSSYGDYYKHPEPDDLEPEPARATTVRLVAEIQERLDTIERLIPELPKAPTSVGHNRPPEEIGLPPYSEETEAELETFIRDTRGQLARENPNKEALRQSEAGFRDLATKIIAWLGRKADLTIDETIKNGVRAGIWGAMSAALLGAADNLSELLRFLG